MHVCRVLSGLLALLASCFAKSAAIRADDVTTPRHSQIRTDHAPARAGASHCFEKDTLAALNDGVDPKSSATPRFTWWPRKGSTEWVEYRFEQPQQANTSRVFWFDDRPRGGCRTPRSWRLLYRKEGEWKPAEGVAEYPVTRGEFDVIRFEPVMTDGFRIEVDLEEGFSSGILEWQVFQAMPPTARETRNTAQKAGDTPRDGRPNVIIVLADDMGYSDIGCFGSEIETPNIDGLAAGGLRFTQFYNAGRCCPSRASLLTGLYPHQADIGHMAGDRGVPGYRDRLSPNAVTIAEVLKSAGYRTLMTGKWHLGWRDEGSPTARGFDRFYGARGYVDSYFTIVPRTDIYLDDTLLMPPTGTPINHLCPEQEWYTTDVFTDYALHFVDQALQGDHPFFLYLAYNAPHFPLHARPEDLAKYRGKYSAGWEKLRKRRYARLVQLGIIEDEWQLSAQDSPDWDSLTEEHKDEADLKMALYAAIVDRLDQNIGRVIRRLEQTNQIDNTLILFLADNGGCAETGMWGIRGHNANPRNYDEWARKGGWTSSYGQAWANVSNVPFRMYKRYSHEGGIATPLIVHWPARIKDRGTLRRQPGHLIDLMATCVDVAEVTYPTQVEGRPIQPLEGRSLLPAFENRSIERDALYWEHEGNRAIRAGDWKLVSLRGEPWELYDLRTDRSEVHDLSSKHPDKVAELGAAWQEWAAENNVLPWSEFQQLSPKRRAETQ